jgi:preprotein translocase subunit SecG
VKVTRIVAVVFMLTCISLAYLLSKGSNRSVLDKLPPQQTNTNAAAPAASATPEAAPATTPATK